MRLAGKRERAPMTAQIFSERDLADRQRHAVPVRTVARHRAAGVIGHARWSANARTDVRVIETHAACGERVDISCAQIRVPVAAEVIAPQLVAHDEKDVSDGCHGIAPGSSKAGMASMLDKPRTIDLVKRMCGCTIAHNGCLPPGRTAQDERPCRAHPPPLPQRLRQPCRP
ncbi:hypothetical protein PSAB6_230362 [Paraburkholderia sabiae]|nr:hypothetical protein PSAB6_230362 [Paraburkholderia sabiae]